jgi:hypothetical protein
MGTVATLTSVPANVQPPQPVDLACSTARQYGTPKGSRRPSSIKGEVTLGLVGSACRQSHQQTAHYIKLESSLRLLPYRDSPFMPVGTPNGAIAPWTGSPLI